MVIDSTSITSLNPVVLMQGPKRAVKQGGTVIQFFACSSLLLKGEMLSLFFCVFLGLVLVLCRFLAKFSSSKGRFLRKIFGSELLFLLSFWVRVFLVWFRLWFSRIFSQFRPGSALKKIPIDVRSCFFCLVLSVLGSGLTTSCVLSLFFFFLLEETKLRSNRTPHPPALAVFFLFFPAALSCFACFGRASFLFWCFFGVPFWAPCGFWILSGLL